MTTPAAISTPSDTEVLVTRSFAASAALVWRAWTTPELVRRWMTGYPGWTMPVCEMDVRVGGKFRWRWRQDADGKEFGFFGEYQEVVPAARLVNTETYDPGDMGGTMGEQGALITATFTESAGTTTVQTNIRYATKADRDAALATGMTDGMEVSYSLLDGVLGEGE